MEHNEDNSVPNPQDAPSTKLAVTASRFDVVQIRNFVAFYLLGTINNLFYVVIGSAAQSIVLNFRVPDLIGLITWANIAFGLFAQVLNGFFLESVPHVYRVIGFCVVSLAGLVGVAFSFFIGFWFAIISIILVGSACSFGENCMLGYMKIYPAATVSGWSSGTGTSGFGALIYLAFQTMNLSNTVSFLLLTPLTIVYFLVFSCLLKAPKEQVQNVVTVEDEVEVTSSLGTTTTQKSEGETASLLMKGEVEDEAQIPVAIGNVNSSIVEEKESIVRRYFRVFKAVIYRATNLFLVYLFEYIACVGCANKSQPRGSEKSPEWAVRNAYVILTFCYSIGVLISRSSLNLVKIKRIEVITILQGLNLALWLWIAKFKMVNVYLQFLLMIYVGLLGGASYVNVYYLILNDRVMNKKDRELAVNMTAIGVTLGITLASLCILGLNFTFLRSA